MRAATLASSTRRSPEVTTNTAAPSSTRRRRYCSDLPTPTPSASAACCAVRAAVSSGIGACGWPRAQTPATRRKPSGSVGSLVDRALMMRWPRAGEQRIGRARDRLPAEHVGDELRRVDRARQVDTGLDAQPAQHEEHVLGRDVAGPPLRFAGQPPGPPTLASKVADAHRERPMLPTTGRRCRRDR